MTNQIIYEKSKFPSIENCTLCKHYLNIPDGDEDNEGDYCFQGSETNELKDAELLSENTVHSHKCNFFKVNPNINSVDMEERFNRV